MKNIKKLVKLVLILVFAVTVFSCKKNETIKIEEKETADTTTVVAKFEPFKIIMIKQKVADYDKWRKAYDSHDSIRRSYGIMNYVMGRGMDDSNMIIVIDKISDLQKAKDFSMSPNLKDAMKMAGVINKPEFYYYDVIRNDNTKIDQKDRLMVTHRVKDFDAWLKVYDAEGTAKRMEEGLIDRGMGRSADDPNMVTLVFAITDMEKAKASINSDAKKKLMKDAGVEGIPEMFYYRLVD